VLYGKSTGLSPISVIVAAIFWAWLWGPIGLILSTPLSLCLVVLGRHVERLAFLDVMFGDRPALSPPEIFYQRMLAGDPTEAAEKAEEFLKERSLSSYYEEVALPGLRLAQADLKREVLDPARLEKIRDTVIEFTADLSEPTEREMKAEGKTDDPEAGAAVDQTTEVEMPTALPVLAKTDLTQAWQGEHPVLCIAGRTSLDEAAAVMFADLCKAHGLGCRVEAHTALSAANIFRLNTEGVAMVCFCYLDTSSPAHIRFAVRRLRTKLPRAVIMLGVWSGTLDDAAAGQLRDLAKADLAKLTLYAALEACIDAGRAATPEQPPIPLPPAVAV
jgi:hypothetical protein